MSSKEAYTVMFLVFKQGLEKRSKNHDNEVCEKSVDN
jgi:hypothetical protein